MSFLPKVSSRASGLASVLKKSSGTSLPSQVWLFLTNPEKPGLLFGLRLEEILRYQPLLSGMSFLNQPCKARPASSLASVLKKSSGTSLSSQVCLFLNNPAKPGLRVGLRLEEILRYQPFLSGMSFLNQP
jgi:hypothetical protein